MVSHVMRILPAGTLESATRLLPRGAASGSSTSSPILALHAPDLMDATRDVDSSIMIVHMVLQSGRQTQHTTCKFVEAPVWTDQVPRRKLSQRVYALAEACYN